MPVTASHSQNSQTPEPRLVRIVVFTAFFLSGLVGLVYETIWMRMLTFVFGSTTLAVSTALAAFMGGLALGSYVLGKFADKTKNHLKTYILLEVLVGLYGLSTLVTLTNLDKIYLPLLATLPDDFYLLTAVRFVLAFLVIGIGAFLMGGTLPVISRIIIKEKDIIGEQFGRVYAVNTFGAVFGVLLAGYYLIPSLGLRNGIAIAALINFAIAIFCFLFFRHSQNSQNVSAEHQSKPDFKATSATRQPGIQTLLLIAFATSGFASLASQVLWTKSLALIIGSSVYAFTIMLATFLFGIAAGSMIMVSLFDRIKQKQYFWFGVTQLGIALSVLVGTLLIGNLPMLFLTLTQWMPHNFLGIQLVEFFVASLAMLPSTLLMGAAFPLVFRIYSGDVITGLGARIGVVYAINTVGAVTGAVAAGFLLIPYVGTQATFKILAALYLVIGVVFLVYGMGNRKKWGWFVGGGTVVAGVLTAVLSPAWNPVLMNSNFPYLLKTLIDHPRVVDKILAGKAVYTDEDMTGSVMVNQMYDGSLSLSVSGHSEGGTYPSDMNAQIEQAVLPAVIHQAPKKVLLVGLGAGITLGALLQVEGIEQVDLLEISSGAVKANRFFSEYNHHALDDPRVNVIVDDGRHYLARTQKKYDLIIIAPSYSWVSGTSNIFTHEFYSQARHRLAVDGLFVAWFHLYDITPLDIKRFVKTFSSVFPDTSLWLASSNLELIVMGSDKPLVINYAAIQQKLNYLKLAYELARVARPVPESLLGLYLMSGEKVADYAADAEINSDNHPVMEFSIPRHIFKWDANENIQSLTGRRYAAILPLEGVAFPRGESVVIPSVGLKSTLTGWDFSASFANVFDYSKGVLERRSEMKLLYHRSPYTFEFYASPATLGPEQLKAQLLPFTRAADIQPGQFAGRTAYWTQRLTAKQEEIFVSWSCPENQSFLGRFSAPSGQNNTQVWSLIAKGLQCI